MPLAPGPAWIINALKEFHQEALASMPESLCEVPLQSSTTTDGYKL